MAVRPKSPGVSHKQETMAKNAYQDLGRRERQIMDVVHQLGEASVTQVRGRLPDPPSYSSVRTTMRLLEQKGYLRHSRDGIKYVYRYRITQRKLDARHCSIY